MVHEHGRNGEEVLRLIAQKERELEAMVARAREEAARLIEIARRDAAARAQQAREEAAKIAQEYQARADARTQGLTDQVVGRARGEAEALRQRAAERLDDAVRLVVERVLGGAGE